MSENTEKKVAKELGSSAYTEDYVALKIGVIGVGNAGNQAITTLYKAGITQNLLAVNTSAIDLSDKVMVESIPAWLAGKEGRGAGKNREKAEALFKANGRELFESAAFNNIVERCDVIIVTYATGGGTGSLIGPKIVSILQQMLEKTKKVVIAYCITPKLCDSPQAHYNNVESLNDTKKTGVPVVIEDLSTLEDVQYEIAYPMVLNNIVEYVKTISGAYSLHTGNGMMDQNDMLSTISASGYQAHYHLTKITQQDLESKSIQSLIIDQMKKSTCMNIQRDGKIEFLGVITSYPASMSEVSRTGDYSELYNYLGNKAKDCYENYGETNTSTASVHVIMSGMTMPWDKILMSEQIVKEHNGVKAKAQKDVDLDSIIEGMPSMSGSDSKIQGSSNVDATVVNNVLDKFFG